jgi:uncharacterized membrane protein
MQFEAARLLVFPSAEVLQLSETETVAWESNSGLDLENKRLDVGQPNNRQTR